MIIYNAGTDCLIGDPLGEKILQKYIEQCWNMRSQICFNHICSYQ
jgi:hypothetical protein